MVKQNTDRRGVSLVWKDDIAPGDEDKMVIVYATGEDGDVHNKTPQKNTGEAGVFFPFDFSGSSNIEIREADGNGNGTVLYSGTLNL